jgi:tetratricopeptide (TPR) repeat protein
MSVSDSSTTDDAAAPPEEAATSPHPLRRRLPLIAAVALLAVLLLGDDARQLADHARAVWWLDRAEEKLLEDDFDAALANIERAFEHVPDEKPHAYYARAQVRLQAGDLHGALADYDAVIERAPNFAAAYGGRAEAKRRLGMDREAIEDLNRAVALSPAGDPLPLNHRAYCRALAGVELPLALADIERALELSEHPEAALLDTRGFIHYQLGNLDAARDDMARAIALTEALLQELRETPQYQRLAPARRARWDRLLDENLAVMLHHRGLIRQARGQEDLAQQDQKRAKELGFAPERGVE